MKVKRVHVLHFMKICPKFQQLISTVPQDPKTSVNQLFICNVYVWRKCIYLYIYIYIYIYTYMYIYMYIYIYICIYIYNIYHIYIMIYVYIHTYLHIQL